MKQKVVLIAPDYFPHQGGVEKHLQMVTRQLVAAGWEVQVVVRYSDYLPEHQTVEGVEVWRLPASNSLPALTAWWLAHRTVFRGATAVHSHDFYPRHLRKLVRGVRWVHTFHGYEGYPLDPGAIASRQLVRREVPYCFGVGAFIEKWYGTKLDTVTYGAAELPDRVVPAKDGAEIVLVGRLEEDTGFKTYLEGFELIHRRHPEVRLDILGDGSLRTWAESYIAEHQLPARLLGWVNETAPHRAAARLMFVSGYLAILEAAQLGKPVVAHYGTPIKQDYLACHPLAADMVIVSTPKEVAAGYDVAARLPTARLEAMQAWAKAHTWKKLADQYIEAYTHGT